MAAIAARQQRRDAANGDTAIEPLRSIRRHLQIILAVALRGQVLERNLELLGQHLGDRFCAPVRKRQVVLARADGIRVAFDQEDLVWIAADDAHHGARDAIELVDIRWDRRPTSRIRS